MLVKCREVDLQPTVQNVLNRDPFVNVLTENRKRSLWENGGKKHTSLKPENDVKTPENKQTGNLRTKLMW